MFLSELNCVLDYKNILPVFILIPVANTVEYVREVMVFSDSGLATYNNGHAYLYELIASRNLAMLPILCRQGGGNQACEGYEDVSNVSNWKTLYSHFVMDKFLMEDLSTCSIGCCLLVIKLLNASYICLDFVVMLFILKLSSFLYSIRLDLRRRYRLSNAKLLRSEPGSNCLINLFSFPAIVNTYACELQTRILFFPYQLEVG